MPVTPKKKSARLLTFDLLRGYFLVSIVLNHLYWYPNGLDWVAARGDLFVTAAEGFFLISGIILGIVRGRKLVSQPFRIAAMLLLKRGIILYITSILLMLVFTLIGWWFFMDDPGLKAGIRPPSEPFGDVLAGALSFTYIYGWADYLRLYSLFILISPIALWLLRKKLWYILIAASVALWLAFPSEGTTTKSAELLMPVAWQLIFFGGFTIGFYWDTLTKRWNALSKKLRTAITSTVVAIAITTIVLNILIVFTKDLAGPLGTWSSDIFRSLSPYLVKESLPIGRLLLFATWFWFGFWLFKKFEPQIIQWFGWILLPFGSNSLYVYIVHAVILFFAHIIMLEASPNPIINAVGSIIVLGIIWLCVRYKVLMKIIPR